MAGCPSRSRPACAGMRWAPTTWRMFATPMATNSARSSGSPDGGQPHKVTLRAGPSPRPAMTAGTRSLFARPGVGLTANVVQHCALRFSNVVVDSPALILLRHGTKSLQCGSRRWTLQGGDAIAVAGGQAFNVSNRLSAAGLYEA